MSKPRGAMSSSEMMYDHNDPKNKFEPKTIVDVSALLKDYGIKFKQVIEDDKSITVIITNLK